MSALVVETIVYDKLVVFDLQFGDLRTVDKALQSLEGGHKARAAAGGPANDLSDYQPGYAAPSRRQLRITGSEPVAFASPLRSPPHRRRGAPASPSIRPRRRWRASPSSTTVHRAVVRSIRRRHRSSFCARLYRYRLHAD